MALSPNFAQYSQGGPVGILPYQSMFATDSTRVGLFEARSSFVRMLNIILARNPIAVDRPDAVAALNVTTPYNQYQAYRRPMGATHIEATPPSTMWEYQVYSLSERNSLLLDPAILTGLVNGGTFRVLVNGIGNMDQPQWSVYLCASPSLTGPEILANPSQVFTLATTYDYIVASILDRNALLDKPITLNQQVMVTSDTTNANGFWTLWRYVGLTTSLTTVDANGFQLIDYQTCRTSDFWTLTNWYATGYSVNVPPVVVYATPSARDLAENPNPKTTLVKILNDGTGSWVWTAYASGVWSVVARQNGTVAFSTNFYTNPALPVIGLEPFSLTDLADLPTRDGSWELRVLYDLIQDVGLLEPLEVNEIFFSMLHFIHAKQDQVAWAFKTSFMTIGGYNQVLTQTPVQPVDNTTNLEDYLDEVMPYRVKIRNFTQIITPNMDNASVHATDFDFPLYYDSTLSQYRELSINNVNDLVIIQNTAPWSDWYSVYLNPEFRSSNYVEPIWNGVRHFTLTLRYDRVDHMPVLYSQQFTVQPSLAYSLTTPTSIPDMRNFIVELLSNGVLQSSTTYNVQPASVVLKAQPPANTILQVNVRQPLTPGYAGDRIQQFYDPTNTTAEKNLRTLLGLNYKGNVLDGGMANNAFQDYQVDGNTTGAETDETINPNERYYGFADPTLEANRPEELISTGTGESLRITGYDANNSLSNVVSFSTARPAQDLYAPQEVGDFDARPLDSVPYDVGVVYEQGSDLYATTELYANGVDTGNVQRTLIGELTTPQTLQVIRHDAFEWTSWSNVGGVLAAPLLDTDNTIVITSTVPNTMPFMLPVVELVQDPTQNTGVYSNTITAPGVVWINDERVEYFDFSIAQSTVTLSQLRRGTHNTRLGVEQFQINAFAGDGTTTTFTVANSTAVGLNVSINDAIRSSTGAPIVSDSYTGYHVNVPKTFNSDYTLAASGPNVTLTFMKAPPSPSGDAVSALGANAVNIYVTKTTGILHPQGSQVFNGYWTFYPG